MATPAKNRSRSAVPWIEFFGELPYLTDFLDCPARKARPDRIAHGGVDASRGPSRRAHTPIWATAFYAGPRLGELRGLRWDDIDFDKGVIHVERSWDDKTGPVEPKSKAGRRSVPIVAALRGHLVEHKLRSS